MINNIYGNSQWLDIQTYPGNTPYINNTQPIAGNIRYNNSTSNGCMEVYDGSIWHRIGDGTTNIDLNDYTKDILTWAEKKMQEERRIQDMLENHPGLKELHDKFEMMKLLCDYEEKNNA